MISNRVIISNRIELAEYFTLLGFTKGAEIGVADGRYSEILLKKIPSLELYSIDPWMPYKGNWRSNEYQLESMRKALERLSKYPRSHIIRATSLDAYVGKIDQSQFEDSEEVEEVPDNLDFVFIDGAHDYDNVMLDIILWTRKVKKGGIVALHDYSFFTNAGIVYAVNKYTEIHKLELNIIPRNQKGEVHIDDRVPCAYWFKK